MALYMLNARTVEAGGRLSVRVRMIQDYGTVARVEFDNGEAKGVSFDIEKKWLKPVAATREP